MRHTRWIFIGAIFLVFLSVGDSWCEKPDSTKGVLVLQGKVLDSAGNPLSDANVLPYLNGKPFMPRFHGAEGPGALTTGKNGLFMIEIPAPSEKIRDGKWALKITRPSFKPSPAILLTKVHNQGSDQEGRESFVATTTVSLERYRGTAFVIALIVFIAVYVLIAFEILHRTLAAFLGATVLLVLRSLS
jgi:hypothetical protein